MAEKGKVEIRRKILDDAISVFESILKHGKRRYGLMQLKRLRSRVIEAEKREMGVRRESRKP